MKSVWKMPVEEGVALLSNAYVNLSAEPKKLTK